MGIHVGNKLESVHCLYQQISFQTISKCSANKILMNYFVPIERVIDSPGCNFSIPQYDTLYYHWPVYPPNVTKRNDITFNKRTSQSLQRHLSLETTITYPLGEFIIQFNLLTNTNLLTQTILSTKTTLTRYTEWSFLIGVTEVGQYRPVFRVSMLYSYLSLTFLCSSSDFLDKKSNILKTEKIIGKRI